MKTFIVTGRFKEEAAPFCQYEITEARNKRDANWHARRQAFKDGRIQNRRDRARAIFTATEKEDPMDPNATLAEIRAFVRNIREDVSADARADELAELFEALDQWLSKRGFLPDDWQKGR